LLRDSLRSARKTSGESSGSIAAANEAKVRFINSMKRFTGNTSFSRGTLHHDNAFAAELAKATRHGSNGNVLRHEANIPAAYAHRRPYNLRVFIGCKARQQHQHKPYATIASATIFMYCNRFVTTLQVLFFSGVTKY